MSDRIDKIREAAKDISDDFISHKALLVWMKKP